MQLLDEIVVTTPVYLYVISITMLMVSMVITISGGRRIDQLDEQSDMARVSPELAGSLKFTSLEPQRRKQAKLRLLGGYVLFVITLLLFLQLVFTTFSNADAQRQLQDKAVQSNLAHYISEHESLLVAEDYSIRELLLEIQTHPEYYGTTTYTGKETALTDLLVETIYKNYDREHPLYKKYIQTNKTKGDAITC